MEGNARQPELRRQRLPDLIDHGGDGHRSRAAQRRLLGQLLGVHHPRRTAGIGLREIEADAPRDGVVARRERHRCLDRRHVPAQVLAEPLDTRRAGVRIAFRGTAAPEVVGFRERIGLTAVDGEDDARHGGQPGQPGGLEAAAACHGDIRGAVAPDQQRLQDAVRSDRAHERLELGAVADVLGLDRVRGDHADDRSD